MTETASDSPELLTVGHSTHEIEYFLKLLRGADIELIADVRRFPGSRRNPQFGADALAGALDGVGIGYMHLPELGGRRSVQPDSPNEGWKVAGFRGYADHLRTDEFKEGQLRLEALARGQRTAVMCAEGPPWRCHRRLISDVFTYDGWQVLHLMPDGRLDSHVPPPFARRGDDGLPIYPAGDRL